MGRAWDNIAVYILICKELDAARGFTTAEQALEALREHRAIFPECTWRVCKFVLSEDSVES